MLRNRLYYRVKPFLPAGMRVAVRRWFALRQRARVGDVWPILPGSEKPPAGWPGWPDGKQFAVVLTHDVEGPEGLVRCRQLMKLEMDLGFRSSFNFIPEGDYQVPRDLIEELKQNGFEVGVHDLNHDGKLYSSRAEFAKKALRINQHLKNWGAVGFRSGFMHHNLPWMHDLDVQYDSSTFDTDPFEPQPDGAGTIFPFWVPAPGAQRSEIRDQKSALTSDPRPPSSSELTSDLRPLTSDLGGPPSSSELTSDLRPPSSAPDNHKSSIINHKSETGHGPSELQPSAFSLQPSKSGYVELPYTLAQDSTLLLLFQEKNIDIWKTKLDWLAEHGGMALLDVHPDYVDFAGTGQPGQSYPVKLYAAFLNDVKQRYAGRYWQPLPREVADYAKGLLASRTGSPARVASKAGPVGQKKKIWFDLDNTPHIPFFEPIIEEMQQRDYDTLVTARDAFQVCELARKKGLPVIRVGRHHGRNRARKLAGLFVRALQLLPLVRREKPDLAVSHGSRAQLMVCNLLRIPSVLIDDYEHSRYLPLMRPAWAMLPEVIPDGDFCRCPTDRVRRYPGLKEDVYASRLRPDAAILAELRLRPDEIIVTARPPADEAHYHNADGDALFHRFMDRACAMENVRVILLPRNLRQEAALRRAHPRWFENSRTVIPHAAVDGLNLLWHSDLVVGGGGTMNREAAVLGVPVYSLFRGPIGAVDLQLEKEGRLIMVETTEDVQHKIKIARRIHPEHVNSSSPKTLSVVVDHIADIARLYSK